MIFLNLIAFSQQKPLEFWIGINPDEDIVVWPNPSTETAKQYEAMAELRIPQFIKFHREGLNTTAFRSANVGIPINWDLPAAISLRDYYTKNRNKGKGLILQMVQNHCNVNTLNEADWYSQAWYNNMRWKAKEVAQRFPAIENGINAWMLFNEPDMNSNWFDIDNPGAIPVDSILDRMIAAHRETYQELRSSPKKYLTASHPAPIMGPTLAYNTKILNADAKFTIYDILTRKNGEYLNYIDAITTHNHNVQSRITSFLGEAPTGSSLWHTWNALQEAQKLNPKLMPVCVTEIGINYDTNAGLYSDRHLLKKFKNGILVSMMHYYGVSMFVYFSLSGSTALAQNLIEKVPPFTNAYPEYFSLMEILNISRYDIDSLQNTKIVIPTQGWEDYYDPLDWAIHADQQAAPVVSSGVPFKEWERATKANGELIMKPGGRNLAFRPVHLHSEGKYEITAVGKVSGGGTIRLEARGYDKLNGLAYTRFNSKSSEFDTLKVEFTLKQHTVKGLPNPRYVLVCLDHDGTGTAVFKDITIKPVGSLTHVSRTKHKKLMSDCSSRTRGSLTVRLKAYSHVSNITIYDTLGRVLQTKWNPENETQFDNLATGMVVVAIKANNDTEIIKTLVY